MFNYAVWNSLMNYMNINSQNQQELIQKVKETD